METKRAIIGAHFNLICLMSRRKPAPQATPLARRAIASLAARLMAEDGIADYGQAKRKATRNLGLDEGVALPGNEEVETELRAYQSLYQPDEMRERLQLMRQTALEAMEALAQFRPCLTGSVLDGTAGRYSEIELDLFADSAKDVEIFLLSRNLDYAPSEPRRHGPDSPETLLRLDWNGLPLILIVYPLMAERSIHRNPHSGGRNQRARAGAVAALLEEDLS